MVLEDMVTCTTGAATPTSLVVQGPECLTSARLVEAIGLHLQGSDVDDGVSLCTE